jgi:surfeit locus 1 family protein
MSSAIHYKIVAFLAALIGTVILISLGNWQLQRGAEKAAIKAAFDSRINKSAIVVNDERLDVQTLQYYRATVTGQYDEVSQILIDNRIYKGHPGLDVITPFKVDGSERRILVNRGWIPWSLDRSRYQDFETSNKPQTLDGLLIHPSQDYYTLERQKPDAEAEIWQNLDLAHFEQTKSLSIQPLVLLLAPDENSVFKRSWPAYNDDWIARHHGYAVQWFGLAFVLVVIYIVSLVRASGRKAS